MMIMMSQRIVASLSRSLLCMMSWVHTFGEPGSALQLQHPSSTLSKSLVSFKPPSIARLLAYDCLGEACAAHVVYYTVLPASLTPNALNSSLTLLQEEVSDLLQTLHDAPAQG